jgi:hypothetical protein
VQPGHHGLRFLGRDVRSGRDIHDTTGGLVGRHLIAGNVGRHLRVAVVAHGESYYCSGGGDAGPATTPMSIHLLIITRFSHRLA